MTNTSPPLTRLYEPDAYDTAHWPDSHWAAQSPPAEYPALGGDASADFAVIGAGYTGLSAALELATQHGGDVVVLEAGQPGWGASGRNGGFCCMGGARLSDSALIRRYGPKAALQFHQFQRQAVEHVAHVLQEHNIDAQRGPDGELCLAHSQRAMHDLRQQALFGDVAYGHRQTLLSREALRERGLSTDWAEGALHNPVGFPLQPMQYLQGLLGLARAAGVRIHGASSVTELTAEADGWRLRTVQGQLRAKKVLLASNGYSAENLPDWIGGRSLPALSSVLTTRVLSDDELNNQGWHSQIMAYDSRNLLHYWRLLPDKRLLIGMRGATRADRASQERHNQALQEHMAALFPAWGQVDVERRWSGFVCLTGDLTPFAGAVPGHQGLYAGFGWHGNGVALSSLSGTHLGRAMAGAKHDLPELMQKPPRRFRLPRLRRAALSAYYALAGWRDGAVTP